MNRTADLANKIAAHAMGNQADTPPKVPLVAYEPFPIDTLPEPIRTLVVQGAAAIACDASYIALPHLAALGAAIGNTRRISLSPDWSEPPIIWSVIVGDSGTQKSPALDLV